MKRENLKKLAQLKAVILGMEKDFGLDDLTEQERRILSAMSEIGTGDDSLVSSKAVRNSLYCADLSAPTYHRALKACSISSISNRPRVEKPAYIGSACKAKARVIIAVRYRRGGAPPCSP